MFRKIGVAALVLAALAAGALWPKQQTPEAMRQTPEEPPSPQIQEPIPAMTSPTEKPVAEQPAYQPKTDEEWKKVLTPEQYRVTRQKGTERAFTGEYFQTDKQGVYRCVCCGEPLFSSQTKFDAHCGWPSFSHPIEEGKIRYLEDLSHGMERVEVQCRRCGAHLGHVFEDGPQPTGQRYCINSVSLKLEEQPAAKPR